MVASYGYLAYVLLMFEGYKDLLGQWASGLCDGNVWWLAFMLLLAPLNWLCESQKWRVLTRGLEQLSVGSALKSVMAGNTAAFFTPNRLGEIPGRCAFLSEGNRLKGVSLSLIVSLSQTLVIMMCGLPAAIFYLGYYRNGIGLNASYIFWICASFFLILTLYYFMPQLVEKLSSWKVLSKLRKYLLPLERLSKRRQTEVLVITMGRYFVFCFQFYCLLRFFGVSLGLKEGAIGIATNYLFVTFTPSMAFSEGSVRASVAVLVFSAFTNNEVAIIAAGLSVWLINFVLPMICGSWFWSQRK